MFQKNVLSSVLVSVFLFVGITANSFTVIVQIEDGESQGGSGFEIVDGIMTSLVDGRNPWVPEDEVQIFVDVPADGTYYLFARVKGNDGSSDSFLIAVDNVQFPGFMLGDDTNASAAPGVPRFNIQPNDGTWHVQFVTSNDLDNQKVPYELSAGTHIINWHAREPNSQVDWVGITDNPDLDVANVTIPGRGHGGSAFFFRNTADINANIDRVADGDMIAYLESEFGLTVSQFSDTNAAGFEMPASVDDADVVFVSETTNSGNTRDQGYHEVSPTALLTGEQALQDDYTFQAGTGNGNNPGTSIEIVNNSHPITQGLPLGEVQIFNAEYAISELSVIPEGVTVLGTAPGDPSIARLWLIEAGTTVNGTVAPGLRVSVGLSNQEAFNDMTGPGRRIIRNAFAYALGALQDGGGTSDVHNWELLK